MKCRWSVLGGWTERFFGRLSANPRVKERLLFHMFNSIQSNPVQSLATKPIQGQYFFFQLHQWPTKPRYIIVSYLYNAGFSQAMEMLICIQLNYSIDSPSPHDSPLWFLILAYVHGFHWWGTMYQTAILLELTVSMCFNIERAVELVGLYIFFIFRVWKVRLFLFRLLVSTSVLSVSNITLFRSIDFNAYDHPNFDKANWKPSLRY